MVTPALILVLAASVASDVDARAADGGLDITIVRADPGFPPPIPLGLLPADAGPAKALWPKDVVALAELEPLQISPAFAEAKQAFDAALYPHAIALLDAEAKRQPLPLESRYLRALAMLRVGLSAEAARELIALADLMPALRARCLFSAAVALEDQKAFATAADVYAKAAAAGPESAVHRDAVFGEARMRLASAGGARAEEILVPISELPAPAMGFGRDLGAEALLSLAQLADRRGQGKKAAKLYRDLWLKHPLSALAEPAEARARALGTPAASLAEQVARAEVVLAANRNAPALTLLTPLAAQAKLKPRTATACAAHFDLGKALKKQRRHTEALREFGAVLDNCKTDEDVDLRARTLYLAGQSAAVVDPARAKKLFTELADAFPDNSFADDALFFAADVEAKNLGEPEAARAALDALVKRYPTGDYAGEARFRLFWLARQEGDGKKGADQLSRLADSGPAGAPRAPEPVQRARYWLGQTAGEAGQLTALAAEWPASYYGDLARAALAQKSAAPIPAAAELPSVLHAGTMLDDPNFRSGLALLRLGFNAAADEELLRVDRQGVIGPTGRAEPMLLLALALHRAGDPRSAHAIAKMLIESDSDFVAPPDGSGPDRTALTRLLFEVAYPRAFRPQIEKWAGAAGVPPDLLQGLMREESALDPQALSGAGAIGLCQLMPATGKRMAKKLGLGAVTPQQLQEPELNIRLGAAYLGELLKRFKGRQPLAVAAYNAGEGAVDKWLEAAKAQAGGIDEPLDAFVEEIPIAETRHYVKRVLTSAAVYRTLPTDLPLVAVQ